MNYTVPSGTRIGHSHLKVSDLDKALSLYRDILGFEVTQRYGSSAVFLSAGGYHHHIGLNTWYSKGAPPASEQGCGLFHTAILYATRLDLARAFRQVVDANYPITGAADHGVSEAIYLNDPDNNGIELYWDKPKNEWPVDADGNLNMYTRQLDLQNLLAEIKIN